MISEGLVAPGRPQATASIAPRKIEPRVLRRFASEFGEAMEEVACPLCDGTNSAVVREARDLLYGRPGAYRVVRCNDCSLNFVNPRPTFESLGSHYPDDYLCYISPEDASGPMQSLLRTDARARSMRRLNEIERVIGRLPGGMEILDVGCGLNDLLALIRELRGAVGLGVDMKDTMVAHIRERLKMPAVHGTLFDAELDDGCFDLVTMTEYLEHELNPCGVLSEARRVLRPGGHIAVEIPDIEGWPARFFGSRWANLDLPRHLVFFDRKTAQRAFAEQGFEIVSYRRFGLPLYLGVSLLFALGYQNFLRRPFVSFLLSILAGLPTLPLFPFSREFVFIIARAT